MAKCKTVNVKGLNNPDVAVFMECIDQLIVLSNKLIHDLTGLCQYSYDNVNVGELLSSFFPLLNVYNIYISTKPQLIDILHSNDNKLFLQAINNHPSCEEDFDKLLNKPIDRLTDYQQIIAVYYIIFRKY